MCATTSPTSPAQNATQLHADRPRTPPDPPTRHREPISPNDDRLTARGREAADNARWAATRVIERLANPGGNTLASDLLELVTLVEHARRENPGMRGSELLPKGDTASPGRRPVEMLLRGIYSVDRTR